MSDSRGPDVHEGELSLIDAYVMMTQVADESRLSGTIDTILQMNPNEATLVSLVGHPQASRSALTYFANRIADPRPTDDPQTTSSMAWGTLRNPAVTDDIAQAVIHAVSRHAESATDPDLTARWTAVLHHRVANDPVWCRYLTERDWSRVLIYAATR